jgi:hypothetical protein
MKYSRSLKSLACITIFAFATSQNAMAYYTLRDCSAIVTSPGEILPDAPIPCYLGDGHLPVFIPPTPTSSGLVGGISCPAAAAITVTFPPKAGSPSLCDISGNARTPASSTNVATAAECQNKCDTLNQPSLNPLGGSSSCHLNSCTFVDNTPKISSCASTFTSGAAKLCVTKYNLSDGTVGQSSTFSAASAADCHAQSTSWTSPSGIVYSGQNCTMTVNDAAITSCTSIYNNGSCTSSYNRTGGNSFSVTTQETSFSNCQSHSGNVTSPEGVAHTGANCAMTNATPISTRSIKWNGATHTCTEIDVFADGLTTTSNYAQATTLAACHNNATIGSPIASFTDITPATTPVPQPATPTPQTTVALPYQVHSCSGHYRPVPNTCELTYIVGRTAGENISLNRTVPNVMRLKDCRDLSTVAFTDTTYGALTTASCNVN